MTRIAATGIPIPIRICSCRESPEVELSILLLASDCEGFGAEDAGVTEVASVLESVVVLDEKAANVVGVEGPVALAMGTSTETAVTVVVDVVCEFPPATLPHINMTEGTPILVARQLSSL